MNIIDHTEYILMDHPVVCSGKFNMFGSIHLFQVIQYQVHVR